MAALAAGASVRSFEQGFMAPVTGYLTDRFGPRLMALSGITILVAGLVMLSQVHALWTYYLSAAIIALGFSTGGISPFTVTVMNWFDRQRGRAMGLVNTGNGLGYVVVSIMALLVTQFGWREALLLSAGALLVVCIPLALLIRTSPEAYGLSVDGEPTAAGEGGSGPRQRTGLSAAEAARTPAFYMLALSQAVNSLGQTTWLVLQVPHLLNVGYSAAATGTIVGAYGISQVILRPIAGWAGDRLGRRRMFMASFVLQGIGLAIFALLAPERQWLLPLYYLTYGVGHAASVVVGQTMAADYFGTRRFATIRGTSQVLTMPAGLASPIIAGWMFDRTGDYSLIFLVYAGIAVTGMLWVFLIRRPLWRNLERDARESAAAGH